MNPHPHPIIARRDLTFQAISLVLATGATIWCAAWSIPLWIIALFVLQFFRDPARQVPQDEGAVLSPAYGRIVAVGRTGDVYARREAIKFSVSMNVFNVHSNRSPVDGAVEKMQYFPGKFMNADRDKASTKNGRNAVILKTVGGQAVTAAQVAGLIARRILRYVKAGDVLQRGRRYGFIRSGSRVDVYLPLTATVREAIADKVSATTTILAILPGN